LRVRVPSPAQKNPKNKKFSGFFVLNISTYPADFKFLVKDYVKDFFLQTGGSMYSLIKTKKSPYYQLLFEQSSGKRTTISTKTKIKSEALKFLTKFKEIDIHREKIKIVTINSFEDIYIQYSELKHTKNYIRTAKSAFKILQEHFEPELLLKELTPSLLESFLLKRFQKSKSGAWLNYRTLKASFEKAVEWKYLSSNPLKIIKLPKVPHNNVLVISKDEFRDILCMEKDNTLKLFYEFAKGTGMRLSEIINLRWNQINLTENTITVSNTEDFITKSKRERLIPIGSRIHEIITYLKPGTMSVNMYADLVFKNSAGIKFLPDHISKRFKKCVKDAEVNNKYHFHNLRSTFASDLLANGVSIYIVQQLLGHSSVVVTERNYSHLQKSSLFEAIKNIDSGSN